ncbi:50S ribosomal protein L25/general stress protein Ctc [Chlamydia abortus]|uniref:Large ribosomal subunit protein bL25 n=1 Tax=Chlamydia abortus (strain DSM 27085 / S26/3) TaxID=218497 RepID=RL25_CHLAB|nr:50S ribosomal protein L25/general stress protein Ctc [Chlamydia abortus]Q5L563.1 RecName: Full=Large ribosomal subunit protein bL25; AltName: Full=50S ribosomal protein L25; AltName: Full=General stress protein CTC [Chlamydia abortus S26/3]ASD30896.1 50S ribosomal protein L25 [Chlamydia abortus]AUS60271.1 LSU ribosomal protein L25p [Chlamydia abortus]EGK69523.1 50S ribosomal protein L25 [Chlamydia abortus LLG]QRR31540.1 50S ribosomal protein L25/general stress protein Ctc [Chlamydia abortus
MELVVTSRETDKKSLLKKIRQTGGIPAVIYSGGKSLANIVVDAHVFSKFLSSLESGALSSTIFSLSYEGRTIKALVKDIQYHVTSYRVIHLDFEELIEDRDVKLKIPIRCINAVDCVGVKLGGSLRQVIRALRVVCKPKDIVPYLELDVRSLGLSQTRKLSDIQIPAGLRPITPLKEVAVTVSRR